MIPTLLIGMLFGIPAAIVADKKGFRGLPWLFTGLVGLIVVCCLASAKAEGVVADQTARRAKIGNIIGTCLFVIAFGLALLAVFAFVANPRI